MKKKSSNLLLFIFVLLVIVAVVSLLCRFILFKDSFETVYYVSGGDKIDTVSDVEYIFASVTEIYF